MSVETGKNVIGISPLVQDPTDATKSAQTALGRDIEDAMADKAHYQFTGTCGISVADSPHTAFGNGTTDSPFSVLVTARHDSLAVIKTLMAKYSASQGEWVLRTGAVPGGLDLYLIDTAQATYSRATAAFTETGRWHTFCGTYDGRGGSTAYNGINLYIDGVQQTVTTVGNAYTAMGDKTGRLTIGAVDGVGFEDCMAGGISRALVFNYVLSADKIRRYSMGAKLAFEDAGGSMVNLLSSPDSDFASSTGLTWAGESGGTIAATGGEGVWTTTSAIGTQRFGRSGNIFTAGKRYRITFSAKASRAGGVFASFERMLGTTSTGLVTAVANPPITSSYQTYIFEGTSEANGNCRFYTFGVAPQNGDTLTIDNISIIQLGAVLDLEPESATPTMWHDESGNQLHCAVSGAVLTSTPRFAMTDFGRAAVVHELVDNSSGISNYQFRSGNYLLIPDSNNLSFGDSLVDTSFSVINTFRAPAAASAMAILSKTGTGGIKDEWSILLEGTSGRYYGIIYDTNTGGYYSCYSDPVADGRWHTGCFVYDGTMAGAGLTTYMDGVKSVYSRLGGGAYTAMHNGAAQVAIGSVNEGASVPFIGQISRNLVFNYAISEEKIRRYSAGAKLDWDDVGGSNVNIVVNGGFDSDTQWSKGTGWSIAGGVATKTAGTSSDLMQNASGTATFGRRFRLTYTVTMSAGTIRPLSTGWATTTRSASGTYSDEFVWGGTDPGLYFRASADFAGTLDNVTLVLLGCVLDLEPENITDTLWVDASPNGLHATSVGVSAQRFMPQYSTQNYVINGALDFNQRAVTVSADGAYGPDRWFLNKDVTTCSMARQAASWAVSGYANRLTLTTRGANGTFFAAQPLETTMVKQLAGKTITLSCLVQRNSTLASGEALLIAWYGTGTDQKLPTGGGTLSRGISYSAIPTSGAVRISATFTLPSTATSLAVAVGMGAAAVWPDGSTLDFSEVMLNEGPVPALFQRAGGSVQSELALCQRYYEKSYQLDVAPGSTAGEFYRGYASISTPASISNNGFFAHIRYAVTKRITPSTVTIYSYSGNAGRVSDDAAVEQAANSGALGRDGASGFSVKNGSGGSIAPTNSTVLFAWTSNAEL